MMSRRIFLGNSAAALAMLGVASALPSCASVVRADLGGDQPTDALRRRIGELGMHMLELASLAPSSHNVQPWRVRCLESRRWELTLDPHRFLPATDPTRREMWLSVGAFVENLHVAAANRGLRMRVQAVGDLLDGVLRIDFTEGGAPSEFEDAILRRRRTVRKNLLTRPLAPHHIEQLAKDCGDMRYHAPDSAESRDIAMAVRESTKRQNNRTDARRELSDWIHWSNKDARLRRDGLTPATMDITGIPGLIVRMFYSKEDVLGDGFAEKGNAIASEQSMEHGGWITIGGGNDSTIADCVDAGRRFERLCLHACALGIAVHPMSQPLQEVPWNNTLHETLHRGHIHFLLRVGYLEHYPEAVSLRRPVSEFAEAV